MGLLKIVFIFAILLFPLGEVVRVNLADNVVIKPLDIGIGVLFLSWLMFKLWHKQKIKQTNILLPTVMFVSSGLFSLIKNDLHLSLNEFFISFAYLLRWIAYAGVFFVVSDFNKKFKRKISKLLIIIGSFIVGLGYVQFFFYPNLRNLYYLGWDEHMHRMFSVFLDPNFAGSFFVLFFLFLINIIFRNKNIAVGLLAFLTLGAVFLTFSRSALIMLIVSSSLFFILINKKKWIVILLGITLLVLGISSKYSNIENINLFRVVSSEARFESAREAVKVIQDYPVFGVGFNAYKYAKINFGLSVNSPGAISHADAGTDNSFLFVLATTGIAGIIFYLNLLWSILKKSYLSYKINEENDIQKYLAIAAIASLLGIIINSLFINSLFYSFIMIWLWILLGLTNKNDS